jgi:hypothetical protein
LVLDSGPLGLAVSSSGLDPGPLRAAVNPPPITFKLLKRRSDFSVRRFVFEIA